MKRSNRKILLILNDAPTRPKDVEFSNIELLFLAKNTISLTQPLNQGIIKAVKDRYKTLLTEFILSQEDANGFACDYLASIKRVDIFQTYKMLHQSWNQISVDTIINCWRKTFENMNIQEEPSNDPNQQHIDDEENLDIHEVAKFNNEDFIVDACRIICRNPFWKKK